MGAKNFRERLKTNKINALPVCKSFCHPDKYNSDAKASLLYFQGRICKKKYSSLELNFPGAGRKEIVNLPGFIKCFLLKV